jgi:hypothetical protein
MNKIMAVVLSFALLVSSLSLLGSSVSAAAEFTLTSDTSVQKSQLQAYSDLKAMFSADPVDLEAVKAKYTETVQADVKASNEAIDEKIVLILNYAIEGQLNTGQAKQAVDKGLQWFFYSEITRLTKGVAKDALKAGDQATAKAALEQAIELYAGALQGTAGKRDSYFAAHDVKTQDLLDTVIIPGLQAAVDNKEVLSFNLYRQMLDKTLIKVFHLATLKYAVEAPKQADAEKARAEVTEGYFFYMPIFDSLTKGSEADAKYIESAFASGDPSKLDAVKIKAAYAAALNGKISGYVNKTIYADMASGDLAKAQEHAMEGNMFLAAEEVLIKEKLGADAYNSAIAHGEMYLDAVKAGDVKAAELHSFGFLKVISELDGVHLKINTNKLTVDGEEKQVDAQSYINPQTSRTLVPARFIAEALGADVNYIEATKTVVITKDGVKTELVVGSNVVLQNAQVKESLQLDQPVVVKDARSFIPLRAVAELFGNKVFYSNYEVVIVK